MYPYSSISIVYKLEWETNNSIKSLTDPPLDSDGQLHKHKILNANKSEKNVFQDQSMKT